MDFLTCALIGFGIGWMLGRVVTSPWIRGPLALFLVASGVKLLLDARGELRRGRWHLDTRPADAAPGDREGVGGRSAVLDRFPPERRESRPVRELDSVHLLPHRPTTSRSVTGRDRRFRSWRWTRRLLLVHAPHQDCAPTEGSLWPVGHAVENRRGRIPPCDRALLRVAVVGLLRRLCQAGRLRSQTFLPRTSVRSAVNSRPELRRGQSMTPVSTRHSPRQFPLRPYCGRQVCRTAKTAGWRGLTLEHGLLIIEPGPRPFQADASAAWPARALPLPENSDNDHHRLAVRPLLSDVCNVVANSERRSESHPTVVRQLPAARPGVRPPQYRPVLYRVARLRQSMYGTLRSAGSCPGLLTPNAANTAGIAGA